MDSAKQLRDLSKVYMEAVYGGGKKEEKKDTRLVVTAADKKANTKAYQNYKAGNKAYKAADHLGEGIKGEDNETRKAAAAERKAGVKTRLSPSEGRANVANMLYKIRNAKSNPKNESVNEGKKADKDYDGDGKIESGKDEYFGSKDKAIKKAMGKELKDLQKAAETGKGEYVAKADKVKGVGESVESDEYIEIVQQIKSAETQADIKRWKSLEESGKFTAEEIDMIIENDLDAILVRLESAQHRRNPEGSIKDRFKSTQTDPSKDNFTGIGDDIGEIMRQNAAMKKAAAAKKKVKKEEFELDEAERSIADRIDRKRKLYDKTTKKAMDDARNTGEASGHNRFNMSRLGDEIDKLAAKQK